MVRYVAVEVADHVLLICSSLLQSLPNILLITNYPLFHFSLFLQPTAEDRAVRQSATLLFKNLIKRRWHPEGEHEDLTPLNNVDREPIKVAVIGLLPTTPPDVQKQLAEVSLS